MAGRTGATYNPPPMERAAAPDQPRPRGRTRATIVRLAALLVAFLLASELGLRAIGFVYPVGYERSVIQSRARDRELRAGTGLHVVDRRQLWKPRPGAPIAWARGETVNAAGMRGPEVAPEKPAGVLRIAALGEGATFGDRVPWKDTWCAQLAARLESRGIRAEILCAGVIDSSVRQGVERYRELVRAYRPDVVVCAYDGDGERLPAPVACTDDERISGVCGPFLDRGKPVPAAVARVRADVRLAHLLGWLADLARGRYWPERFEELQERRLSVALEGFDVEAERRVPFVEYTSCLVTLEREVEADGAHLLLLAIPDRRMLDRASPVQEVYWKLLADVAREEDVAFVDGRAAFEHARRTGIPKDDLVAEGSSLSACGHATLAEAVADRIVERLDEYAR